MERRRLVVAVLCLLVHGHVSGFSFTQCGKRPRFDLFAATEGAGGDADAQSTGAGAYRSKAKEFASDPESFEDGLDDKKTLTISFVTGNAMKQREISMILSDCGEDFVDLKILDVDLPEIQEINTEAIAKDKARQGAQLAGGACVVEDTSLEFHALGGMPGPFIKWFQDKLGCEGLYKILTDYEDKSASAVCTLAFCPYPHADPVIFTGRCSGKIVEPQEGQGFGWDTIFVPDGETEPFSQMSTEKKCTLSHRSKAVVQWAEWIDKNVDELWARQYGKPAVGHKGLNFKPESSEQ